MQKCTHCSNQFKRSDIMKSIWLKGYGPIICPNCDMEYVVDFWSQIKIALLAVVPFSLLTLILKVFLNKGFFIIIMSYILWIILLIYLTPTIVSYNEKVNKKCNEIK